MVRPPRDLPIVHLMPSRIYLAQQDADVLVHTVLGSCISVVLYHKRFGLGGICHSVLPKAPTPDVDHLNHPRCHHYTDCAVQSLIQHYRNHGFKSSDLVAKLFGGARMLRSSSHDIGGENVAMALHQLARAGIKPAGQNIGGTQGRSLYFQPSTGEVWLKRQTNATAVP